MCASSSGFLYIGVSYLFVIFPKDPLLKGQRCVILADGFYEWQKVEKGKQPFFIYFPQTREPCQETKKPEDDPTTAATNKEKSETVRPPGKSSSGVMKVWRVF